MRKLLFLVLIALCSLNANADLNLGFDYEFEGWTPRYFFARDDHLLGKMHYGGISYFERKGNAYEGPTLRYAKGQGGEKFNIAFTSGFSLFAVDFGASFVSLDSDNSIQFKKDLDGLGIELGLRFWVIQIIGYASNHTTYVEFGYGF